MNFWKRWISRLKQHNKDKYLNKLAGAYLGACVLAYRANKRPSSPERLLSPVCRRIGSIFNIFLRDFPPEDFVGFLNESHYLVNLWTAHLVVENFEKFPQEVNLAALSVIVKYAAPQYEKLALEEGQWLQDNVMLKQRIESREKPAPGL